MRNTADITDFIARNPRMMRCLAVLAAHRPADAWIGAGFRLGQDGGGLTQGAPSRAAQSGLAVHPGNGSVQPGAPAKVAGGGGITPGVCPERTDRAKKITELGQVKAQVALKTFSRTKMRSLATAFQQPASHAPWHEMRHAQDRRIQNVSSRIWCDLGGRAYPFACSRMATRAAIAVRMSCSLCSLDKKNRKRAAFSGTAG